MSHVKAGGSSDNTHKSAGRRNGVKRFGGQKVNQGEVLVRQTGSTNLPAILTRELKFALNNCL